MTGNQGDLSLSPSMADPSPPPDEEPHQEIIKCLEELEPKLKDLQEIPEIFHDIPLICMRVSTDMELCYRLDPPTDVQTDNEYPKDYRGMAEWAGLETVYIKYLTRTETQYKTTDVLAKWSTMETEPLPTLGNLQKCLCGEDGIDRPDVITDLAHKINKDAFEWKMDKYRANTTKPQEKDYSWQLTRQDMIVGKRTYYTCCLIYADEDEGLASRITNLFKAINRDAVCFNPQFDLKTGRYEHATTAEVIEERCGGKVIFIVSEYFFASPVCQFTVHFAKGLDMVITGEETYYTACLVYADEDENMAEVINRLYTRVYPRATFFRPQFDLKRGKYVLETTGKVIQERCGGKAIFLLSEYFLASDVCQFAVNFTASVCRGTGVGNLIPFHLTARNELVPAVLKGIAGIRWFRRGTRKYAWQMVTDTIMAQEMQEEELISLYERIDQLIDREPSTYLTDPTYDESTQPPGEPIKVIEPEGMKEILEQQNRILQDRMIPQEEKLTRLQRFVKAVQKRIFKNVNSGEESKSAIASSSSQGDSSISQQNLNDISSKLDDDRRCESQSSIASISSHGASSTVSQQNLDDRFSKSDDAIQINMSNKNKSWVHFSKKKADKNSLSTRECVDNISNETKDQLIHCDSSEDCDSLSQQETECGMENTMGSSKRLNTESQKNKSSLGKRFVELFKKKPKYENEVNDTERGIHGAEGFVIVDTEAVLDQVGGSVLHDSIMVMDICETVGSNQTCESIPMSVCDNSSNQTNGQPENKQGERELLDGTGHEGHDNVECVMAVETEDQCISEMNVDPIQKTENGNTNFSEFEILYSRRKGRFYIDSNGKICTSAEYSNSDSEKEEEVNTTKRPHREAIEHDEFII